MRGWCRICLIGQMDPILGNNPRKHELDLRRFYDIHVLLVPKYKHTLAP